MKNRKGITVSLSNFSVAIDSLQFLSLKAARTLYNRSLRQTVPSGATDANGDPLAVPNPALIGTDAAWVQKLVNDAVTADYERVQHTFRIPTGEWLLRFTMPEKKGIRAIGAGKFPALPPSTVAMVNVFLDRLDENPIVKLSDNDVEQGVPLVMALLAQTGVIPSSTVAERSAAILALNI